MVEEVRALGCPGSDHPKKISYHFHKKSSQGVRAFFVYSFLREEDRQPLLFYDAEENRMIERRGSPEWGAVMAAAAPLHVMAITCPGTAGMPGDGCNQADTGDAG